MTKWKIESLLKVSPKGQIILKKEIRKAVGIKPNGVVRVRVADSHVLIEPFDIKSEITKIEEIAKKIGKRWPKGLSAAEAVRRGRK